MASAIDVAKHLIKIASQEPEREHITNLRLQKLLYYVQGWSLATNNAPMFREAIQAWVNGPVVPDAYLHFKPYKGDLIPTDAGGDSPMLSDDEKAFIRSIWQRYGQYSAAQLWRMTHTEAPWLTARQGYDDSQKCNEEISHDSMRAYFTGVQKQHLIPGLEREALDQAEADFRAGRGVYLDDVLARIG